MPDMSVNDADLELLETFLDGELPANEQEILRRRLIFEAALSQTLEALRFERTLRAKAWQSMEPNIDAMERVVEHVDRKVNGHLFWSNTLSKLKMVSAAAACIVVGVMVGRFGIWNSPTLPGMPAPTTPAPVNTVATVTPAVPETPVKLQFVNEYGEVVDTVTMSPREAADLTNDFRKQNERQNGPNGGAVLTSSPANGDF